MQKLTAQERPWSEQEKVSLLAEIIKLSSVPPNALVRLIRDFDVHPRWEDTPLPEGRSLNSSKLAFDEMNRQTGFYQLHPPSPYLPQAQQGQIGATTIPRKRQLPGGEVLTPSFAAIQPKPPGLSPAPYTPVPADAGGPFRRSPGDSAGEPAKKRRGRPSNAQIEQEKATAAAEGREWQPRPPRAPRKRKSNPNRDSPPSGGVGPSQQTVPHTSDIQMAEPDVDEDEEASSSKKRRRKTLEEPAVVRPKAYDPIRPSPSEGPSTVSKGSPAATQQPPPGRSQLATAPDLNPEYHPSTTKSPAFSENPQHMSTEQ